MKKIVVMLLMVGCCVSAVMADEACDNTPKADTKKLAVVPVGDVDPELVSAVKEYVEFHSFVPVRVLPQQDIDQPTLREQGIAVSKLLGDDIGMIALVQPEQHVPPTGTYIPENKVVAINVTMLGDDDADAEKVELRVKKEALRGLGMLMGLQFCPNPRCCMSPYNDLSGLDKLGGNYCPPCLGRVMQKAKEDGAELITPMYPEP